jgi:hypothetical protein
MDQPEEPQVPIFTFESNGAMEIYESRDDLEGHVEPLFVEELRSAFDCQARPVKVSMIDGASLIALASPSPDLQGLKTAAAAVPWLLASDFPTEESSVRGYVNALLTAYNRAVERDAQRRGLLDRLFKRRS